MNPRVQKEKQNEKRSCIISHWQTEKLRPWRVADCWKTCFRVSTHSTTMCVCHLKKAKTIRDLCFWVQILPTEQLPLFVAQSWSGLRRLRQTGQDIGLKSEGQSLSLGLIKGLASIIRLCVACVARRLLVLPAADGKVHSQSFREGALSICKCHWDDWGKSWGNLCLVYLCRKNKM